jgi:hypothetical protein
MVIPKIRLGPNLREDGDRVARTISAGGVPIGDGVTDGLGEGTILLTR